MIKNTNLAGFTLIELLVVIVIIGVLATISILTFGSYQEKARNAKITSMMKQFDDMMNNFAASNGYYFPRVEQYSSRRCMGRYKDTLENGRICGFRNKNTGVFTYLGSTQLQDDNDDDFSYWPTVNDSMDIKVNNPTYDLIRGAYYQCLDTECSSVEYNWYLEGTGQDCGIASAKDFDWGGQATRCYVKKTVNY